MMEYRFESPTMGAAILDILGIQDVSRDGLLARACSQQVQQQE